MENQPISVLVAENEPAHAEAIRYALGKAEEPYQVRVVNSLREAHQAITQQCPDIVIADLDLTDGKAFGLLAGPSAAQRFPVLLMTSYGNEQVAVQAMKAGAIDYVVKSADAFAEVPRMVSRALREWRLIQERRRAEEALRDALQFTREVISCAGEGIVVLDERLRIVVWNRFMEEFAEMTADDALGREAAVVFPQIRAQGVPDLLARALSGETVTSEETAAVYPPTEQCRWFVATYAPHRDASGRIVGVIATVRDVTERKRAVEERLEMERRLLHSQRLESLGVLAGGIAHDFNNLLTSMLGNASLALDHLQPSTRPHRFISQVEKAALRAAELTNQMLAYSGKGSFSVGPLDLTALVREMGELLRTVVPRRIDIHLQCADGLPIVRGDASQIRQVVMNLITNAGDAVGDGHGDVIVRTRAVTVEGAGLRSAGLDDALPDGSYVVLEVTDTGCGMDAGVQERLFDPFFTTKFSGRGLGMAAVLGIVRGHGGGIQVDSALSRGTTIRVYLPATEAAPAAEGLAYPEEGWSGQGTVLVVDDEPDVLAIAATALEHAGFRVIRASDGAEAIDRFRSEREAISAVVLDVTMPRLGGEEVLAALHAMRPGLPVILSSGYAEGDVRSRLSTDASVGFIQKPYRPSALIAAVRGILESGPG